MTIQKRKNKKQKVYKHHITSKILLYNFYKKRQYDYIETAKKDIDDDSRLTKIYVLC
jgi:hypothetical protein